MSLQDVVQPLRFEASDIRRNIWFLKNWNGAVGGVTAAIRDTIKGILQPCVRNLCVSRV